MAMKTIMRNPVLAAVLAAVCVVAGGIGASFVLGLLTNVTFVSSISNPVVWAAIAVAAVVIAVESFRNAKIAAIH